MCQQQHTQQIHIKSDPTKQKHKIGWEYEQQSSGEAAASDQQRPSELEKEKKH